MAGADTEPWTNIFFRATSDSLSIEDIKSMTTLVPTESYNIGDERKGYRRPFPFWVFLHIPPKRIIPEQANPVLTSISSLNLHLRT